MESRRFQIVQKSILWRLQRDVRCHAETSYQSQPLLITLHLSVFTDPALSDYMAHSVSKRRNSLAIIITKPATLSFCSKQIQIYTPNLSDRILVENLNITMLTLSKIKSSSLYQNWLLYEVCNLSLQDEIEELRLYGFSLLWWVTAKNVFHMPLVSSPEQEKVWG